MHLSDYRGHPVVLNFWASWCPPCRKELPAIKASYEKYLGQGAVLLAIDQKEAAATVKQAAQQSGMNFPILLDTDGSIGRQYAVRGTPTTIFLDAQGIVQQRYIGPISEDQYTTFITPLLVQPAPTSTRLAPALPGPFPLSVTTNTLAFTTSAAITGGLFDFSLPDSQGKAVRLSSYRGHSAVALVFYRQST